MNSSEELRQQWRKLRDYVMRVWSDVPDWFRVYDLDENESGFSSKERQEAQTSIIELYNLYGLDERGRSKCPVYGGTDYSTKRLWSIRETTDLILNIETDSLAKYEAVFTRSPLHGTMCEIENWVTEAAYGNDKIGVSIPDKSGGDPTVSIRSDMLISFTKTERTPHPIPLWMKKAYAEVYDPSRLEDGRSNTSMENAIRNMRALVEAIRLLLEDKDRQTYWRGDRINSSLLSQDACLRYEQRTNERKTASTSVVARTIRDAVRLDSRRPQITRANLESDQVRGEYLMMSVLWCLQKDWKRCVHDERLSHITVIEMISENYKSLWPKDEYRIGTKENEADLLSRTLKLPKRNT